MRFPIPISAGCAGPASVASTLACDNLFLGSWFEVFNITSNNLDRMGNEGSKTNEVTANQNVVCVNPTKHTSQPDGLGVKNDTEKIEKAQNGIDKVTAGNPISSNISESQFSLSTNSRDSNVNYRAGCQSTTKTTANAEHDYNQTLQSQSSIDESSTQQIVKQRNIKSKYNHYHRDNNDTNYNYNLIAGSSDKSQHYTDINRDHNPNSLIFQNLGNLNNTSPSMNKSNLSYE